MPASTIPIVDESADMPALSALEQRLLRAKGRAAAMAAPIPKQIGPYRIQAELGSGGMGYVYRARHVTLDRIVALKLIRAEHRFAGGARERFLREARVASRLEDPGLCRVYEFGEHEGLPWFAMQLIEGESLAERLDAARQRGERSLGPPSELATLFAGILEALHVAHADGLVHRDIKPSNIVLRPDGQAVVLDFGVARDSNQFEATLTASGQMIGTPLYLPREQVDQSGARDDRRWDVYSTAVTLYECLTLERPFDGESPAEIFDAILAARPVKLSRRNPEVGRPLELVVETAMDPDPERRYPDCLSFAADLRRAARGEAIEARAPSLLLRTRRWVRANPVAASVLSVLAIATVATGTQWLRAEENLARVHLLAAQVRLDKLRENPALALPARAESSEALASFLHGPVETLLAQRAEFERVRAQLRDRALPYGADAKARDAREHPLRLERGRLERELSKMRNELARERARLAAGKAPLASTAIRLGERQIAEAEARIAEIDASPADLRSYEFSVVEDQFLHDGLDRLIADLGRFEARELEHLRAQLAWSQRVEERTITSQQEAWSSVAARLLRDARFQELRLPPQLGLVPLGPDPTCGLEEFAFARSGSVPTRDGEGKLRVADDTALILVLVPDGDALHGSTHAQSKRSKKDPLKADLDEIPQHRVKLGAFFIGKHELTQAQWAALTNGERPSFYRAARIYGDGPRYRITDRHPVESVSHDRARIVLGLHELSLPSEAQWEYACRAGTTTAWWPGDNRLDLAGCENLGDRNAGRTNPNWHAEDFDDGQLFHAPVMSYRANAFGLHDLHGNVREWCADRFQAYANVRARTGDGLRVLGATPSPNFIVRGGAFDFAAAAARSARRDWWAPSRLSPNLGLRVARRIVR